MKKIFICMLLGASMLALSSCSVINVDAGQEAVIVDKPLLFGHGGVRDDVVEAGLELTSFTVSKYYYSILPEMVKEGFDDLATKDGTPVDFDLYFTYQIKKGGAVRIHKEFGQSWYKNNLQPQVRSAVRNEVRNYTLAELRMDPKATDAIQDTVVNLIKGLIEELALPVMANNISLGKAVPPKSVLEETARTAAQKQREQTQAAKADAEMARAKAELQKAIADKAYTDEFKMSTDQFLQNKFLDILAEKQGISIVTNGALPTYNVNSK